jgi:hypothetical protein
MTMLKDVGVLAMPTLPFTAPISPGEAPFAEFIDIVLNTEGNTCSFDVSEPPAFTVPRGLAGGLPAGPMPVVRHFEKATMIPACPDHRKSGDWKKTRAKPGESDNDTNGLALSRIARGR